MLRQTVRPIVTATLLAVAPAAGLAQDATPAFAPKSPGLAVGLSLLGTVVPTYLAVQNRDGSGADWLLTYGVFFGPSTGYFYSGRTGRAFGGAAIRLGFTALTAVGISTACGGNVIWGCEDEGAANVVALLGLGLLGLSAVYDIVGAGSAVREWNARHQPPRLSLRPQINPVARSGGLAARIEF